MKTRLGCMWGVPALVSPAPLSPPRGSKQNAKVSSYVMSLRFHGHTADGALWNGQEWQECLEDAGVCWKLWGNANGT
jgi:hypothetical protein